MMDILEDKNMPDIKSGQLINLTFCNCRYVLWKTKKNE
jgi:hypothetical protein